MSISDYKIQAVINVYLRNLKMKVHEKRVDNQKQNLEDKVEISDGAIKRLIVERAKEKIADIATKHDKDL